MNQYTRGVMVYNGFVVWISLKRSQESRLPGVAIGFFNPAVLSVSLLVRLLRHDPPR